MIDNKTAILKTAVLCVFLWACTSETPSFGNDGGTDTDYPVDYRQHFTEGGGTTGGPVEGLLVLWLVDDPGGDPISGARVMVGSDPDTALWGETDSEGMVVFEDDTLLGPLDIHLLAEGYPVGSIFGLNATFVTLERQRSDYNPQHSTNTITGETIGIDNVPDPTGAGEIKAAIIKYGLPTDLLNTGEYEEIIQHEVDGKPVNMVVPLMGTTSWTLETYQARGTLYGFAGLLNQATKQFKATHIAIQPGFDPEADTTNEPVLDFSIPLEDTIEITVENIPAKVENLAATAVYDFAEDGAIGVPSFADGEGGAVSLSIPSSTQERLADGIMDVMVLGTPEEDEDGPSTVRIISSPTLTDGVSSLTVNDLIDWPDDLSFDDVTLQVALPNDADHFSFTATNEDDETVWGAAVWGSPVGSISLPPFPEEWGWTGLESAALEFEFSAIVFNGDINEMAFDDIRDSLVAFSENYL